MANESVLDALQSQIWAATLPVEVRIAAAECRTYDQVEPYLIAIPRLTYLPSLFERLLDFFAPCLIADADSISLSTATFVFESVVLKWHLPIGLLYDLHVLSTQQIHSEASLQATEPFRLTVSFTATSDESAAVHVPISEHALNDAFFNAVKEADFLRSGTAKPIMSLSTADSKALWVATQSNDLKMFAKIHNALLPPAGHLRNIPIRVYVPSASNDEPAKGHIKVLQGQFPPLIALAATVTSQMRGGNSAKPQQQTLGTALHALVPSLFPSRRTPLIARPLMHGAQVPMSSNLEDLCRKCCYADGWVNIVVAMTN